MSICVNIYISDSAIQSIFYLYLTCKYIKDTNGIDLLSFALRYEFLPLIKENKLKQCKVGISINKQHLLITCKLSNKYI